MINVEEQLLRLKNKGIQFNIYNLEDAKSYLLKNNNYFKISSFRFNFNKYQNGKNKGKYMNLDFAHLKDLSIIDMRLRYEIIHMLLDIEHYAKVKILNFIESTGCDDYKIVVDYFESLSEYWKSALRTEIKRNETNPYCRGILNKYSDKIPVYAFLEIVSLGTLINFYEFVSRLFNSREMIDDVFLLKDIKQLRNAVAHNNVILFNMGENDAIFSVNNKINKKLNKISHKRRNKQFKNERMRQIITMLYSHTVFVTSTGIKNRSKLNLTKITERMYHNINLYKQNENIKPAFDFIKDSIEILFKD